MVLYFRQLIKLTVFVLSVELSDHLGPITVTNVDTVLGGWIIIALGKLINHLVGVALGNFGVFVLL